MTLTIGTPTIAAGTAGNQVVNKPAGVADGDLLIATMGMDDGVYSGIDAPAGWTIITAASHDSGGGSGVQRKTFYRVISGDGASYTFTALAGNSAFVIVTPVFGAGASPTFVAAKDATNTTETCPSVTPTDADDLLLCWSVIDSNGGTPTWTPPSGMTELLEVDVGGFLVASQACLLPVGSTSPTGTKDFAMSGVSYRGAGAGTHFSLAIADPAGGPPAAGSAILEETGIAIALEDGSMLLME